MKVKVEQHDQILILLKKIFDLPVILYLMMGYQADLSSNPVDEQHFCQERVVSQLVLQQRCNLYSIYQLQVCTVSRCIRLIKEKQNESNAGKKKLQENQNHPLQLYWGKKKKNTFPHSSYI